VQALGIGTNLGRALEVLVRGRTRVVDAGEVNGVRFNDGLGIGFDAEVAAGVARAPRYLGGFGRYLWSVLRLLPGFQCREVSIKLDNEEIIESKTVLVAVALGTTYGGKFKLAPTSRLDDGLFDLVRGVGLGRGGEPNTGRVARLPPEVPEDTPCPDQRSRDRLWGGDAGTR
jgi:diacylglycerol kinase (ATP)